MPHDVPGLRQDRSLLFVDSDGTQLGECAELRASSRSSLQPDDERDTRVGDGDAVSVGGEEAVVHAGLSLGVVPVDLLVASMREVVPE